VLFWTFFSFWLSGGNAMQRRKEGKDEGKREWTKERVDQNDKREC
jgi:hypothetical protein